MGQNRKTTNPNVPLILQVQYGPAFPDFSLEVEESKGLEDIAQSTPQQILWGAIGINTFSFRPTSVSTSDRLTAFDRY